jgi:hypothetical protein
MSAFGSCIIRTNRKDAPVLAKVLVFCFEIRSYVESTSFVFRTRNEISASSSACRSA